MSGGLPAFNLVGLPEMEVKESRDRVRAALQNAQFEFPARKITVQCLYNLLGVGAGAGADVLLSLGNSRYRPTADAEVLPPLRSLDSFIGDHNSEIGAEALVPHSCIDSMRIFTFCYRSAAHFIDLFRTWYGPVLKAFVVLSTEQGVELERDPTDLINGLNRGGERSQVVPSEYLEIVVTRR